MKKVLLFSVLALLVCMSGETKSEPINSASYEIEKLEEVNGGGVLKSLSRSVAPSSVFRTIASRYRGKVTLIMTWATWCGPCRQAIQELSNIKSSFISRGVKFVFVTGETSPRSDFNYRYPSNRGDHYYLTGAQLQGYMNTLGQQAYPSLVLLNKSGQVVWRSRGYPGNDDVLYYIRRYL